MPINAFSRTRAGVADKVGDVLGRHAIGRQHVHERVPQLPRAPLFPEPGISQMAWKSRRTLPAVRGVPIVLAKTRSMRDHPFCKRRRVQRLTVVDITPGRDERPIAAATSVDEVCRAVRNWLEALPARGPTTNGDAKDVKLSWRWIGFFMTWRDS